MYIGEPTPEESWGWYMRGLRWADWLHLIPLPKIRRRAAAYPPPTGIISESCPSASLHVSSQQTTSSHQTKAAALDTG